ncbi:MAG TPA: 2Fe-2S iron-sulfur cluster binding domain-containing protein [Acidimicrobiia bacterium]|nr:2Fe-2S iron-sulfur cluster binding domain-containing protein [Acidimicrobiia bacterium]
MTTHKVECTFEGEAGFTIECREDEDVVTAALRQGYILLTECREGACSTCKAYLVEGDYDDLLTHSIHALSPAEEEEGYILSCRLQPRSDLVLDYDYPADRIERFTEGVWSGQVVELERRSDTVMRVVVRTLAAQEAVRFEPGQYVRLTLPAANVARDYSMANVGTDGRELEFLIRVLPDGAFSGYIAERAKVGEMVTVEGPFGKFCLRPNAQLTPVFVAGGTGLAPILSMLRSLAASDSKEPATLVFGNTNAGDLFFGRELDELAKALPGLTVHRCLVNPGPDWSGEVGLVTDAIAAHVETPEAHSWYLCGPPPMIAATKELLAGRGVPRTQIYEETFIPSGTGSR